MSRRDAKRPNAPRPQRVSGGTAIEIAPAGAEPSQGINAFGGFPGKDFPMTEPDWLALNRANRDERAPAIAILSPPSTPGDLAASTSGPLRSSLGAVGSAQSQRVGGDVWDEPHRRYEALFRPEARHLGPSQEGDGVSAAELCREFRPIDLRFARGFRRQDPRGGRRRKVLQSRSDPESDPHRRRQRLRAHRRGPGRAPFDAGGVGADPLHRRLWRHHPVGEPQSRRPRRRFRHQVQHFQWRPGAGKDH